MGRPPKWWSDNCKTTVLWHPTGAAPVLNPTYIDFARHYGFTIKACTPLHTNCSRSALRRGWLGSSNLNPLRWTVVTTLMGTSTRSSRAMSRFRWNRNNTSPIDVISTCNTSRRVWKICIMRQRRFLLPRRITKPRMTTCFSRRYTCHGITIRPRHLFDLLSAGRAQDWLHQR